MLGTLQRGARRGVNPDDMATLPLSPENSADPAVDFGGVFEKNIAQLLAGLAGADLQEEGQLLFKEF